MACIYEKYIDKLLDGNLNEDKIEQLEKHALGCETCSEKLKQIEITDKIIKNKLLNVSYISSKDKIMELIHPNILDIYVMPVLYKSRKYICIAASILVIIFSVQFIKPYTNAGKVIVQKNCLIPSNNNINLVQENTDDDNIIQDFKTSIDVHNLKFTLPADWSAKVNQYNAVIFYKNDKEIGGLCILNLDKNGTLLQRITPNHSNLISQENIETQLGNGILAVFEITSPAASPVEYSTFTMNAIIPIDDKGAYAIDISSEVKFSNKDKETFLNIIKQIYYDDKQKQKSK